MGEMTELAREVFNKQVRGADWDDSIFDNLRDLQDNLDTLDSWWNIENYNLYELIRTIKEAIELYNDTSDKLYRGENGTFLQLSDRSTILELNKDISPDEYSSLVEEACRKFKAQTGVEVYCEGRSGRHICVDYTYDNAVRYDELCQVQTSLENWVIDTVNNA